MLKFMKKISGFTLVEMMLSVAVLTLILGITLPSYFIFQTRNDLDIAVTSTVNSLRRAQVLAQSSSGDMKWGVYISTGSILIYKGENYASRDIVYDEVINISPGILITGINDISFSKMYGLPNNTGTTTLTSVNNEIRNISINKKGTVNY